MMSEYTFHNFNEFFHEAFTKVCEDLAAQKKNGKLILLLNWSEWIYSVLKIVFNFLFSELSHKFIWDFQRSAGV